MTSTLPELRTQLDGLMLRDQHRLGRQAERAAALHDSAARERALGELQGELAAAAARAAARRDSVPVISYPPELPVSQVKDQIAAAIAGHQVVIVAGETGSGKTTQLPKICLELGRGVAGQIGHTQPRRIAARTVAERIGSELGTGLGAAVGYKVRFADTSSDATLIKVMTDGILLTEMQRDRRLLRYDTLIIDEAHERSLNIDFILGYLKRLLPRRPDLKVIITSATIDPERFSVHFGGAESGPSEASRADFGAPIVEVSGRTYPVELRYRPLADPDDPEDEPRDQVQGILDAVTELKAAGPGDILVFLSGEREIRDTADALSGQDDLDVLPLYARLSAAEQHRVFEPSRDTGRYRRRVVLATNIAETSLTVPGIRYVIDPGTARISRYSQRTKVQRLPIEPISQASASQRAGRCGRTADGVCIRLYSGEDFAARPEFTDPEIVRTNLASVILQMAALDLGDMAAFPFVDPPDSRNIADGVRLLEELGAFASASPGAAGPRLTDTGRKLARLPADPRLGRMILEAGRNGCAREVLIIAAGLSIVDPRERPAEHREAADAMHARFAVPGSDFLAFLALWDYLRERQSELSASALRRMCRREYLHYLRAREWQDVYAQLRQAAAEVGVVIGHDRRTAKRAAADAAPEDRFPAELADRVHMSLLAGLLSQIGMADTRAPQGKRRGRPVRRRARREVRHLPGLGAGPEATGLGGRGRAGGDLPAVGPGDRADRAGMGRAAGRAPAPAQLQRAALGRPARRGAGHREGHPVRAADRGRPHGQLWPHRAGPGPGPLYPACPGRGRLADASPVLRPQPAGAGRGGRDRAQGAPPGPRRGRHRAVRLLRPAHPGHGDLGPALRQLVEEGPGRRPAPARPAARRPARDGRRGGRPGRLPGPLGRAAGVVRVRPGPAGRRGDRGHPAGPAEPGRRGGVRLAGPRAARGTGDRADPVAAQAAAHHVRAGPGHGAGGAAPARPGAR